MDPSNPQPWSPPEYAPLTADNPAVGLACGICLKPLQVRDITVAVPKRQPTPEEMSSAGEYLTLEAVLVHSLCFDIARALVARQKAGS